jgi:hypothetical protein
MKIPRAAHRATAISAVLLCGIESLKTRRIAENAETLQTARVTDLEKRERR